MQFTIDTDCRRGLRIIEEIPDISLCRIEGYNGIGKSGAIRLLQLCTGSQPYSEDEQSWRTFRDQLASARVRVNKLRGADNIEWIIDPSQWPSMPEPMNGRIGEIRINGRRASIDNVTELLRVDRIVVNETFRDTLAARVDQTYAAMDTVLPAASDRQRQAEHRLAGIQDIIAEQLIRQIPGNMTTVAAMEETAATLAVTLEQAQRRLELLSQTAEISKRLEEVRGHGSELDEQLAQTTAELESVLEKRTQIDEEIVQASERENRGTAAQREFSNAEKHLTRQDRRLTQAETQLAQLAAAAGIDSAAIDLENTRQSAAQQLNYLTALLPQVYSTPLLIDLLDDLIERLGHAEEAGIGEQALLESHEHETLFTVSKAKASFEEQRRFLKSRLPSADAERLSREIATIRALLNIISEIAVAKNEVAKAKADRDKATERLRKAAKALPRATAKSLTDLLQSRNALEEAARLLEARRARQQHARNLLGGGQSESALAAQLVELCRTLDIDASRVHGRLATEEKRVGELVREMQHTKQQLDERRRQLSEQSSQLASVVKALHERQDLEWLRNHPDIVLPRANAPAEEQVAALIGISDVIEKARERLRITGGTLLGIKEALSQLSTRFKGATSLDGVWAAPLRAWLSDEVTEWFSHDEVRQALFPNGQDIKLDLVRMEISWTVAGERQERALNAFSSGEQVMAFTRARLAQLDQSHMRPANRLIAIDEFGAFLDAEVLHRLASYLKDRSDTYPADQIAVILPLTFRKDAVVEPSPEHRNRVRQLEARGYFTEGLLD
ncbi:hypothetical protein [Microbispora rosea]|uniref:hypothetical protein n=1 Tax=Microbispora rosea TaxID=58117 RepID=UPI003D8D88DF